MMVKTATQFKKVSSAGLRGAAEIDKKQMTEVSKTPAAPPANKKDKLPPAMIGRNILPATITRNVPSALRMMDSCSTVVKFIGDLTREIEAVQKKHNSIELARAFVAVRKLKDHMDAINGEGGLFPALFEKLQKTVVPETFEQDGVTSIPLEEGFRVGVSSTSYASIKGPFRKEAYQWLRDNGLEALITDTVNSSTLSAAARHLMEEQNLELPAEYFTVTPVANTSVTAVNKK